MTFLLDCTIKISMILFVALATVVLLRKRSAVVRHWVLSVAVLCSTIVPVAELLMPAWNVTIKASSFTRVLMEQAVGNGGVAREEIPSNYTLVYRTTSMIAQRLLKVIWLTGLVASFAVLFTGFVRLRRIASSSQHIRDDKWSRIAQTISYQYGL